MTGSARDPLAWPWFAVLYVLPSSLDPETVELITATITAVGYQSGEIVMVAQLDGQALTLWVRGRTEGDAVAAADRTLHAVLPELATRLVGVHELGGQTP